MKVTIDIEDPQLLLSGLSHAINCYGDVVKAIFFGCSDSVPLNILEYLEKNNIEGYDEQFKHLKVRFEILKDVFYQLDKEIKDDKSRKNS